jgi:energy-coupling factor transport system ATP-binding protein
MTNPATEPVVVVEDLTFQYRRGTEPALRGVSLEVAPGEVLLVAGPSGCGKSTLIRALNGLIPHSYGGELSGSVRVGGLATQASSLKGLATMVGTVLQEPTRQLVASTVRAELTFGPENLGVERDEIGRRLVSVSSASGLDPLLGRTTDELSGGEAQQIAIGGALMLHPRLLVLDEPLANLDPASADRALYLEDGRVTYLGSMAGFLETADPTLVKLPFEAWLRRARAGAAPSVQPDQRPEASPNGEQPPRIEWNGVDAAYDGRTVLHDVSARLGSHERVAVLGPNGSGKTTLFKAALGLRPLSAGEVLVDGTSIAGRGVAELATTFGYVFQNPSQMLFAATVRDEILFGPRNLLRDPDGFDDLVDRSLVRVGLADEPGVAERPPRTLSHGQQKRLAIGVALALEPRTLVLDEPSAGQDYRSATAFMREVERIAGLESIYFVTHDVDLALTTADRVILLKEGRIAADGTPHQVVQDRERWRACNLRETSLMEANRQADIRGSRFLGPEALAAQLVHASS